MHNVCDKGFDMEFDIETLMRQYGNDVLRTAYMYVKDYHLAEDIFQDVFLKVNQKLKTFRGESNIKTWVIRITINTCKDYIKSAYNQKVIPVTEFIEEASDDNQIEQIEKKEQNQIIRQAVMELPEKYKEVLWCIYFHEMTIIETAQVLHLAVGTVKTRLVRGRDRIRKQLEGRL